jgi:DNA-binding transcriptional regulator GbsR (MarR family)
MVVSRQEEKQNFVEEVGNAFEQTGLPRMAGRIFGWLLICSPPHQNAEQIGRALLASKGSISTSTRLLIQHNLIERVSLPGVRHDYLRLKTGATGFMIEHGIDGEVRMFRQLTERGLKLIDKDNTESREILKEMNELYHFMERELPLLRKRWLDGKKGK